MSIVCPINYGDCSDCEYFKDGECWYDEEWDKLTDEQKAEANAEEQILEEAREKDYKKKEVDKNDYDKD